MPLLGNELFEGWMDGWMDGSFNILQKKKMYCKSDVAEKLSNEVKDGAWLLNLGLRDWQ